MYFSNIGHEELREFHNKTYSDLNISLTSILNNNNLFHVEPIIPNELYRIFPLFYCKTITSSNTNDKIIENKMILAIKNNKETYYSFESEHATKYVNSLYTKNYPIGAELSVDEFNAFIYLLRTNITHNEEININNSNIHGKYAEYIFNLDSTTLTDKGILITNETLTNIGTITLKNPFFKNSTYTLVLKILSINDMNIFDTESDSVNITTLEIELVNNTPVRIPFETLEANNIIGFDAEIIINHNQPIIAKEEYITLSASAHNIYLNQPVVLTAQYYSDGSWAVNKTITFKHNNVVIGTVNTNEYGIATLTYTPEDLGDFSFNCISNSVTSNNVIVQVKQRETLISLTATPNELYIEQLSTLTGRLTHNGVGLANKNVEIKINGELIESVTTNSNGEFSSGYAHFKDDISSTEVVTVDAIFDGDSVYASSRNSVDLTFKGLFDEIILTANKSIIVKGEQNILIASLMLNGEYTGLSGIPVTFEIRKTSNDSLVETLTANTVEDGRVSVFYYGKGEGDLYVKAISNSVSSSNCNIEDLYQHITGAVDTSSSWQIINSGGNYTITTENNMYKIVKENDTAENGPYIQLADIAPLQSYHVEMTVKWHTSNVSSFNNIFKMSDGIDTQANSLHAGTWSNSKILGYIKNGVNHRHNPSGRLNHDIWYKYTAKYNHVTGEIYTSIYNLDSNSLVVENLQNDTFSTIPAKIILAILLAASTTYLKEVKIKAL